MASGLEARKTLLTGGWLLHNGNLQLIINVVNKFVLVEETLLTQKIYVLFLIFFQFTILTKVYSNQQR